MRYILILVSFTLYLFAETSTVAQIQIEAPISPATSSYLKETIQKSKTNSYDYILLELNTPGGVSTAMRDMIKDILNSPIPIITYVSPKGARATSAGTYLLYASHIAAMAPGTNLGAATPISMMKAPVKESENSENSALEKKVLNDSIAYIKSLAELRERNESWAIEAVKEGVSLSSKEALEKNVIDLIAQNPEELLAQIDGKEVKVQDTMLTLNTKDHTIIALEADWKTKILMQISDPNIAYLLMMIAIYGVLFELMNPGSVFPGVLGLISGIIALYSFNMLPFNYAGLILIIFGISLMIAEVFITGFGILGIGGVIAFGFGSFLLFDSQTLGTDISIPLIILISLTSLAFFLLTIHYLLKSRSNKIVSGKDEMIGTSAEVIKVTNEGYQVRCHGEIWSAKSQTCLKEGESAIVESISGLTLNLKSKKE